jgi:hypothetical protein
MRLPKQISMGGSVNRCRLSGGAADFTQGYGFYSVRYPVDTGYNRALRRMRGTSLRHCGCLRRHSHAHVNSQFAFLDRHRGPDDSVAPGRRGTTPDRARHHRGPGASHIPDRVCEQLAARRGADVTRR